MMACILRCPNKSVVPAKAGIHDHRILLMNGMVAPASHNDEQLG